MKLYKESCDCYHRFLPCHLQTSYLHDQHQQSLEMLQWLLRSDHWMCCYLQNQRLYHCQFRKDLLFQVCSVPGLSGVGFSDPSVTLQSCVPQNGLAIPRKSPLSVGINARPPWLQISPKPLRVSVVKFIPSEEISTSHPFSCVWMMLLHPR